MNFQSGLLNHRKREWKINVWENWARTVLKWRQQGLPKHQCLFTILLHGVISQRTWIFRSLFMWLCRFDSDFAVLHLCTTEVNLSCPWPAWPLHCHCQKMSHRSSEYLIIFYLLWNADGLITLVKCIHLQYFSKVCEGRTVPESYVISIPCQ